MLTIDESLPTTSLIRILGEAGIPLPPIRSPEAIARLLQKYAV